METETEEAETTPLMPNQHNNSGQSSFSSWFSSNDPNNRKSRWLGILLGQLLSILLCLSAVSSVYLNSVYNVYLPTFQNFLFYVILSAVFTSAVAFRTTVTTADLRGRPDVGGNLFTVLKSRGWRYFLLALCDAEANFLVVKAYQYTTLTSVQLLDCFTIPTVLLLSRVFLGIKYKWLHLVGVVICLGGVACLVWADIQQGIPIGKGNDRVLGDILCLFGAFLYGVSNVAQEFLVKTYDMVEFLGMIGIFGALITGFQTYENKIFWYFRPRCILEWEQVSGAVDSSQSSVFAILGLLLGFAITQFSFYILAARLMKMSGATVYNLSILTADFYSLLAGIFIFQYKFNLLYFIAFVLVLLGVSVFSIKSTGSAHSVALSEEESAINSEEPVSEN